jgi:hypothetical protein
VRVIEEELGTIAAIRKAMAKAQTAITQTQNTEHDG